MERGSKTSFVLAREKQRQLVKPNGLAFLLWLVDYDGCRRWGWR